MPNVEPPCLVLPRSLSSVPPPTVPVSHQSTDVGHTDPDKTNPIVNQAISVDPRSLGSGSAVLTMVILVGITTIAGSRSEAPFHSRSSVTDVQVYVAASSPEVRPRVSIYHPDQMGKLRSSQKLLPLRRTVQPEWLVIGDVIDPAAAHTLLQRVELCAVLTVTPCTICGQHARFRCKRCKDARYCGDRCQQLDWNRHRLLCTRG